MMRLIFRKRLSFILFSMLFLGLILMAQHLPTPASYAFVADTWIGVGGGKDYRDTHHKYYVVSVPDGRRAWRPLNFGYLSPDTKTALVSGFYGREATIRRVWDNTLETFQFKYFVQRPVSWSPDSKYLAVSVVTTGCDKCNVVYPRDVGIIDIATGDLRLATRRQFFDSELIWSPDQRWLAYVDGRYDNANQHWVEAVRLIPADGSQSPRTLMTHVGARDGESLDPWLHWLPDGRHIAVVGHDGPKSEIWYVDVQTRQITYHFKIATYWDICWSPTSDHFLKVSDSTFDIITPAGVQPLDLSFVDPPIWWLRPGSSEPCAWSPDGTKLVLFYQLKRGYYPSPPGMKIIDFSAQKVSDIQVNGPYDSLMAYWSPDSQMLAVKTYTVSRDPNDIFIYDMTTLQPVFFQKDLEFRGWLILPPS